MKVLFLDCGMGAAGDMMTAALMELLPTKEQEEMIETLNNLGIHGVKLSVERAQKCGISGSLISVEIDGISEESVDTVGGAAGAAEDPGHHHRVMHEITRIVTEELKVSERVKKNILSVYGILAEAESKVHGVSVGEIHFHEVGTMDALMDISAVSILMEKINPDKVIVSPIRTGYGHVKCTHGWLPVPAPATALILKGIPIYAGDVEGELITPTGAALLKYFADSYGTMPCIKAEAIGYGMGKKDFKVANCLRAILGEANGDTDIITQLECNVDDMTAEEIGFATERIMEEGAREVYTIPIYMKKNRPGSLISVICSISERDKIIRAIFKYTSTIGIREKNCGRYVLSRKISQIDTPFGKLKFKKTGGYGVEKVKYEYEDLARIARQNEMSIKDVEEKIRENKIF